MIYLSTCLGPDRVLASLVLSVIDLERSPTECINHECHICIVSWSVVPLDTLQRFFYLFLSIQTRKSQLLDFTYANILKSMCLGTDKYTLWQVETWIMKIDLPPSCLSCLTITCSELSNPDCDVSDVLMKLILCHFLTSYYIRTYNVKLHHRYSTLRNRIGIIYYCICDIVYACLVYDITSCVTM